MGVNPTSPINSNAKDLPVLATAAGTIVLPRGARSSAAGSLNYGVAGQVVGGIGPNGDYEMGVDPQGALYVMPEELAMADAGAYYHVGTVIGTPVAYSITTAFSATAAYLILRNTASAGGLRVYPDFIKLLCTTAPASATAMHFAITSDPTNRYTSGGTAISAANGNMLTSLNAAGIADLHIGVPTIAAAGANVRTVERGQLRTVIPVVGDQYVFQFGGLPSQGNTLNGTSPQIIQYSVPPVVLAPGGNHSMLLNLWFPANATTAPQFEVSVGWWER